MGPKLCNLMYFPAEFPEGVIAKSPWSPSCARSDPPHCNGAPAAPPDPAEGAGAAHAFSKEAKKSVHFCRSANAKIIDVVIIIIKKE